MGRCKDVQKDPELLKLEEYLSKSRSASDFDDSLERIGSALGLTEITTYEVKALLIEATLEKWPMQLQADMTLAALGLLEGFDNHFNILDISGTSNIFDISGTSDIFDTFFIKKSANGKDALTKRRAKFIKESTFVEERYGPHNTRRAVNYGSLNELKAEGLDAINEVIKGLGANDGECLNALASKLWSKKEKINEYLEKAKKKHIVYDEREKHIVGVKLPEMFYIREEVFVRKLLDWLGTTEIETKWQTIIPEIWKRLGVKKMPELALFKLFLLTLIDNIYDKSVSDEVMRRDLSLLMLGFLDYYYTKQAKETNQKIAPDNRYKMYIDLSDFTKLNYFGKTTHGEVEEITEASQFDMQTNSLKNLLLTINECKDRLVEEITQSIHSGKFQEYMASDMPEEGFVQNIRSLAPEYTLENFPPLFHPDSSKKPTGVIEKKPRRSSVIIKDKETFIGIFVVIATLLFAGFFQIQKQRSRTELLQAQADLTRAEAELRRAEAEEQRAEAELRRVEAAEKLIANPELLFEMVFASDANASDFKLSPDSERIEQVPGENDKKINDKTVSD